MLDKDTTLTIRLSSRERQVIRDRAYAFGMSVSQYIRFLAMNAHWTDECTLDRITVKEIDTNDRK